MFVNKSEVGDDKEEGTYWHELVDDEIEAKLAELNRRLEEHVFRTRFRIVRDELGWDVFVDDGSRPELVKTVEEAETIVEELLGGR
jgi:hypothetical protein